MAESAAESSPKRTYDVLLDDVEAGLRSGRFKAGDQLPGERILAETYGISRASVREAMRLLDAMGILRSSNKSGPKSGAVIVSEPSAGLSSTLRLHVASSRLPVEDIVEARILLETWAARTAAERDNPEGIQRARELLLAMDAPDIDPETFHALDAQFHLALSALAGNAVIETIMDSLSGSIRGYIKDALAALGQWPVVLAELRAHHHAIFNAVEARNADLAADLLRRHIGWLHEQTARARP
ncbi:GntR family transcriptional regulator [Arthrobacter sp. PGP41]|uniref:FadR/GntR family transcriptional regulator n=1 Tax=unclassified Arthrobacter TaxID=235627 RepID=UPI000CDC7A9F|nr:MULTISPECIES: FadR/GntR family transcriptional regulator [unclassified Arthrobacter]AUZ35753.1 GntR family transcriptional regulator [Arthrobacter sp. PGP41]MDT0193841.1 FadR/GntR family transcriptional regulator [Arthrobacter sp. AB6]